MAELVQRGRWFNCAIKRPILAVKLALICKDESHSWNEGLEALGENGLNLFSNSK
jgi:hypothetical protein